MTSTRVWRKLSSKVNFLARGLKDFRLQTPGFCSLIKEIARESLSLSRAIFRKLSRRLPTLPHRFQCSTIGSKRLNFRVRDGNGCDPLDKTTGKLVNSVRELGKSNSDHRQLTYACGCKFAFLLESKFYGQA